MTTDFLKHHPVGTAVPNSPHAVCCSLPTMSDIIGYEEKTPETLAALKAGYPRFVSHEYVQGVCDWLAKKYGWEDQQVVAISSVNSLAQLLEFLGTPGVQYEEVEPGLVAVALPQNEEIFHKVRSFLQHTGISISSRFAEDILWREGLHDGRFCEEHIEDLEAADIGLRTAIGEAAGADAEVSVLCSSGMNAFWSIFHCVQEIQAASHRDIWLQIGWLYVDTGEIIQKFSRSKPIQLLQIHDEVALERTFAEQGNRIAGVICEAPTNPLVQTPPLRLISELCKKHGAVSVFDPSMAGLCNVDLLPLADVVTTSLTKYAASEGDVMMGAILLNRQSPFIVDIADRLIEWRESPYGRDVQRLAHEIQKMPALTKTLNHNTQTIAKWLEARPEVRKLWWAGHEDSANNFQEVARNGLESCGCILTLELNCDLTKFYDNLRLVKGPSFGTKFTMACPFMYLAHYNLAAKEEGRQWLRNNGIEPDLIRLSIGSEPTEAIIAVLEEAFAATKE